MDHAARDAYLATIDPVFVTLVTELDRLVRAAHPPLEVGLRYRILVYTLDARWHDWVCAISTSRTGVGLRFLFGAELEVPPGLLRAGSTTMGTLDLRSLDQVDPALVTDLVRRAVAHRAGR